ncbi:putative membrane protein [Streptomyces sp. BK208]|uniref:anthrone oxygenase family protein n=1 Tax=Streptomyces sp. BK208 TaxID=2512150 RepID=UPI00105D52C0|nr:anthrone oxygenase family protein [Streptomyces sp. BK208]TDT40916.1 putative membrane protein [Streptomyces sp. BK208]
MKTTQTAALLAAVVTSGLMAGLFAAFAYAVMPGLRGTSDHTFVETMQGINKAIVNPVFMLPFMGTIPLIAVAVFLARRGHGRPALPWLIAALVLYLVAFAVTVAVNVPLNDQLERAGDPDSIGDPAAVRERFEAAWVTWNIVRALLHTAAFACLAWALVLYGADRLRTDRAAVPASGTSSAHAYGDGHGRAFTTGTNRT